MKKNIIFAALMIVCVAMIIGWYFFDCELFALFNSLPSDTSRLGVVVFVCAFWMPICCHCNILIDKEDVQQAIEFLRIKNKLDPVYERERCQFFETCVTVVSYVVGTIGFLLFLTGFFI